MSIFRLRQAFKKQVKFGKGSGGRNLPSCATMIMALLVVVFIVTSYYVFGGGISGGPGGPGGPDPTTGPVYPDVIAVVGDEPIKRDAFFEALYLSNYYSRPLSEQGEAAFQALQGLIQTSRVEQAAVDNGIRISDEDVEDRIREIVQNQIQANYPTEKDLALYLREVGKTRAELEQAMFDRLMQSADAIRTDMQLQALQDNIQESTLADEQAIEDFYTELTLRTILISNGQVKQELLQERIAAQEEATDEDTSSPIVAEPTRTEVEQAALAQAQELYSQLQAGADFATLAQEHSHDFRSAAQGGLTTRPLLSWNEKVLLAARELDEGEISSPVETPLGYQIIQFVDRQVAYPDDFEENRAQYVQRVEDELDQRAWSIFAQQVEAQYPVEYEDLEMRALNALLVDQDTTTALTLLQQVAEQNPGRLSARYQLATLTARQGRIAEAVALFEDLSDTKEGASDPYLWYSLGVSYRALDESDQALAAFTKSSDRAQSKDYASLHQQLYFTFQEMDAAELAEQEAAWFEEVMGEDIEEWNPYQGMMPSISPAPAE